ncbi:MAG: glycosyltransferase family 39 protein [Candidatus Eisenbacteria bacterium]
MAYRRIGWSLFGTFLALYLSTAGGRLYVNDAYVKLLTARSLLERGSLAIDADSRLTARSPKDGLDYAKFGVLHSILFLPAVATGKALAAAGALAPESRGLAESSLASVGSPFFTALTVALFFLWGRAVFRDDRAALRAALLLGIATMIWPYAKRSWSETPQMTLLVGAALLLARAESRERAGPVFGAGLLVGASVALRITGVAVAPIFLLPLLSGADRRGAIRRILLFGAGGLAVTLPLVLGVNWWRFGTPFSLFAWRMGGFTTPFFEGLAGLLVSPGESLFLYSPVLLLGAALLPRLRRESPGSFPVVLLLPAALLLLYAPWWFHAYTWGPRFLLPAIPFLLLPLASPGVWSSPRWRRAIIAAGILSTAIQILGVTVHLGDLGEMERPLVRHGLLPPDRPLTRADTWWHPLRTRPVSHLLALGDASSDALRGRPPGFAPDFWPWTLRGLFGIPLRATLPLQILLFAAALFGIVRLGRLAWRTGGESGAEREPVEI